MKTILLSIFIFVFVGCSLPKTTVRTVDERPSIMVQGAPKESILFVDGLSMGKAKQYSGDPEVLILETGTHDVKIVENGSVIFEQRVFLGSSLKTIKVR